MGLSVFANELVVMPVKGEKRERKRKLQYEIKLYT